MQKPELNRRKSKLWRPYSSMTGVDAELDFPKVVGAEGSWILTDTGKKLLDSNSSWWCKSLGHRHPRLLEVARRQLEAYEHVTIAGFYQEPAEQLAQELCAFAPSGLDYAFFSDDGSTAIEVALKASLQFFQQNGEARRDRILSLRSSFHGETAACAAVSDVSAFQLPFRENFLQFRHLLSPADSLDEALLELENEFVSEGDKIAAFLLEPLVQGAGGMKFYSAEYLKAARKLCDKHGAILIIDEVFTGYHRLSARWASELAGIQPDILCLSKGLTAGVMPLGATLFRQSLFDGFLGEPERALYYGHTFCGNALACSIAREVIAILSEPDFVDSTADIERGWQEFERSLASYPEALGLRRNGNLLAFELKKDEGYHGLLGKKFCAALLGEGVYARPLGNTIYFAPPVNCSLSDLKFLEEATCASLSNARRDGWLAK